MKYALILFLLLFGCSPPDGHEELKERPAGQVVSTASGDFVTKADHDGLAQRVARTEGRLDAHEERFSEVESRQVRLAELLGETRQELSVFRETVQPVVPVVPAAQSSGLDDLVELAEAAKKIATSAAHTKKSLDEVFGDEDEPDKAAMEEYRKEKQYKGFWKERARRKKEAEIVPVPAGPVFPDVSWGCRPVQGLDLYGLRRDSGAVTVPCYGTPSRCDIQEAIHLHARTDPVSPLVRTYTLPGWRRVY